MKKILCVMLAMVMVLSVTACGTVAVDENSTYGDNEKIKNGFVEETTIKGVSFVIPEALANVETNEEEFFAAMMAMSFGVSEGAEELMNRDFVMKDGSQFMAINLSKYMLMVAVSNDYKDISNATSAKECANIIDSTGESGTVIPENATFLKETKDGVTKVIFDFTQDGGDIGNYKGKVAVIQDSNRKVCINISYGYIEGSDFDESAIDYVVKSVQLTGEAFATGEALAPEEDDTDEDTTNEDGINDGSFGEFEW